MLTDWKQVSWIRFCWNKWNIFDQHAKQLSFNHLERFPYILLPYNHEHNYEITILNKIVCDHLNKEKNMLTNWIDTKFEIRYVMIKGKEILPWVVVVKLYTFVFLSALKTEKIRPTNPSSIIWYIACVRTSGTLDVKIETWWSVKIPRQTDKYVWSFLLRELKTYRHVMAILWCEGGSGTSL